MLGCAACIAVLLLGLACLPPAHAAPARLEVTQALAVSANTPTFPEAGTPAGTVRLPDDWSLSQPGYSGSRWYRVRFDHPAHAPVGDPAAEPTALYIERACHNVEVWLNGQLLHRSGRTEEPITRNCYQPQLVSLPAALLAATGNQLDLRVSGIAQDRVSARLRGGGLSALLIGPQLELAERQDAQTWWNSTALQLVAATLLVLGGYLVVLGVLNRREAYLFYFGVLCVGWALLSVRVWGRHLPLDSQWVEWLAVSMVPWLTAAAVQFLLSYAGRRSRLVEAGLLLQALLVPLTLWAVGPRNTFHASNAWYVLFIVELMAATAIYLAVARRERQPQWPVMALLLACLIGVLLLEEAVQNRWLPLPPMLYAQWGLAAVLFVIAFRLLQGFEYTLAAMEAGRASLERRVRDATAEIERNFAQLAELRVEQVTEKERKRIAADLHDDLGAKLLTIVHTSESDRISTLAREALEEMRLSVRGLTGKPVRLADALADWRAEIVSRLGQTHVEADWRHPTEDLDQLLPARAYVQTTRILREAVSNIIKHSGASLCKVRCTVADHEFGISVQDNGKGIPMELDGKLDRGHGMASMKHRAKQLQGQCLVESGPGYGTVIRLSVPL
jgi:two-component system sensor histidine kinase UhpB